MPITYCLEYPVPEILGLKQNCRSIKEINEFTCVSVQEEVIICFEANNSYIRFGEFYFIACKMNHLKNVLLKRCFNPLKGISKKHFAVG